MLPNKLPQQLAALNNNNLLSSQFYRLATWARLSYVVILISVDIAHLSTVSCWHVSWGLVGLRWPHSLVQQMVHCQVGQWRTPGSLVSCIQWDRPGLFTWKYRGFQMRGRKHASSPEAQTRSWGNVASVAFYWPKQQTVWRNQPHLLRRGSANSHGKGVWIQRGVDIVMIIFLQAIRELYLVWGGLIDQ